MTSKLEHALALAAKGFKVFPIKEGAKAPPLLHDWPAKATTDKDMIGVLFVSLFAQSVFVVVIPLKTC